VTERHRQPAEDPLATIAALPGVAESVAGARDAVDRARSHSVVRRRGPEVAAESALRGARASAALEGFVIDLAELRDAVRRGAIGDATSGFAGGESDARRALAPLLAGAIRVGAQLSSLVPTFRRAPLQALARLHVLAAAGLVDPARLGRPREAQDEADPNIAELPGQVLPALDAHAAAARLDQLARLLVTPSAAPALVVAAIAHGELLAIGAFTVGNGVLARAVSRLVLSTRGLDPASITVPEVGHLEMGREAYADSLRGYASGGAAGVSRWVVHCGDAVVRGAQETEAFCAAMGQS